jgi:glycosyltransferase involved in cell wall biosynthesis
MRLTILSVAYPFAPVSLDTVGGAEQILGALDRGIVCAGHRSVVVALAGSRTAGDLVATALPAGTITDDMRAWATACHQQSIDRAFAAFPIDIVHFHGLDFHAYRIPGGVPALATLHLPPSWYPSSIWEGCHIQLQCVSDSQRSACPPLNQELPVIRNGVPTAAFRPHRSRHFALALGRICPEKNLHAALDAGTLAKMPVVLGGEVFPYPDHQRYFREQIEPRLNGYHRFAGRVGSARKQRLLAMAKCLLVPTLAPETSSLVAMEALAAGTPVIAFPSGAMPEIIDDGVTGFLVQDEKQMAKAMQQCDRIDPQTCRRRAAARFSQARMIEEYLTLYERLVYRSARRNGRAMERYDAAG